MVVQFLFPIAIVPVPIALARKRRSLAQLILGDVRAIATQICIVGQLAPGDRVRVGPNGEKRDERRDGVNHLAAHLLNLKILDGSEVPSRRWLECEGGVISGLFSKP